MNEKNLMSKKFLAIFFHPDQKENFNSSKIRNRVTPKISIEDLKRKISRKKIFIKLKVFDPFFFLREFFLHKNFHAFAKLI